MSGTGGIVMLNHPCALEDGKFERIIAEFMIASFTDVRGDLVPQVGEENDVPQCCTTTKFAEYVEIPSDDSVESMARNAMDVDDPGKFRPFLVSGKVQLSSENRKRRTATRAYVVAKKAAIIFKISVLFFVVSSNPGVSTRVTAFPSRMNSFANSTLAVHDSNPVPTRRSEPLARLINWKHPR